MDAWIRFLIKNKSLRVRNFRRFLSLRFALILALNMQTTVIAYWVYQVTRDVLSLGQLGLCEAIPAIALSLVSGHLVDQAEKRRAFFLCLVGYVVLSLYYIAVAWQQPGGAERFLFAGVVVGGVLRAFLSPSSFTLLGLLVPRRMLANASTWSASAWQMGAIIGPLLGGFGLAGLGIRGALMVPLALLAACAAIILTIPPQPVLKRVKEPLGESLSQGLRFIGNSQILLSVLLLDLFAVLLGGATALLPAFAEDVLHVGKEGFGWLRAANGIGAIAMYFVLAAYPLRKNPGIKMLLCVAGFGGCIIVFGLSNSFALTMAALALGGALDAISVVVRSTILQLYTPDEMRGRVSAVNTMFISSSNELGELESGYTAKWFGLRRAVVWGGIATIAVVGGAWALAPKLRKLKFEG